MNQIKITGFFLFVFFTSKIFSQTSSDSLRSILLDRTFSESKIEKSPKRKFMSLKGKSVVSKINPLTYVAGTMLFVYQRVVSEQISAECCYDISCSSYAKFSIEKFGLVKGTLLGLNQFNNCFGGVTSDYPEYKIDPRYKILNASDLNPE